MAGINASLGVKSKEPIILDRSSSYIGVLLDDLTTKGTNEPYRMFTSRVEYRLILREDNADLRLRKTGYALGLVCEADYRKTQKKKEAIQAGISLLKTTRLKPEQELNKALIKLGSAPLKKSVTLEEILKRPQVHMRDLKNLNHIRLDIPEAAFNPIETEVKYAGFIQRQFQEVQRFKHLEKIRLPEDLDYKNIQSLSREIREKLSQFRPLNLGQASRISGVTPAAISILMVYLKKIYGWTKIRII